MMNITAHATTVTPAARPSTPSIQFIVFVTPTNHPRQRPQTSRARRAWAQALYARAAPRLARPLALAALRPCEQAELARAPPGALRQIRPLNYQNSLQAIVIRRTGCRLKARRLK